VNLVVVKSAIESTSDSFIESISDSIFASVIESIIESDSAILKELVSQ